MTHTIPQDQQGPQGASPALVQRPPMTDAEAAWQSAVDFIRGTVQRSGICPPDLAEMFALLLMDGAALRVKLWLCQ